jgi:hypothetical protein
MALVRDLQVLDEDLPKPSTTPAAASQTGTPTRASREDGCFRIGVDKAIAGALAGARVCALRYDRRGVGASGGEYLRAGMDERRR